MISAATAATAVLMVTLVKEHGLQYLLAATVLAGVPQIGAGTLRLGHLMRFVSRSVMTGFVNALALLIFCPIARTHRGGMDHLPLRRGRPGDYLHSSTRFTRVVPSPLICIIVLTAIVMIFDVDGIRRVGDMGELPDSLPVFLIPQIPLNFETLQIIFPYSVAVAAVGLLESLMTQSLVDDLTDTRSDRNQAVHDQC